MCRTWARLSTASARPWRVASVAQRTKQSQRNSAGSHCRVHEWTLQKGRTCVRVTPATPCCPMAVAAAVCGAAQGNATHWNSGLCVRLCCAARLELEGKRVPPWNRPRTVACGHAQSQHAPRRHRAGARRTAAFEWSLPWQQGQALGAAAQRWSCGPNQHGAGASRRSCAC